MPHVCPRVPLVSHAPHSLRSVSPSVPSSGPTNVSALATTSSSMLVRWDAVPEADRNGLVLGYKVRAGSRDGRLRLCTGFPTQGALPP